MHDYINGLINDDDYYLTCHDFNDYIEAQKKVEEEYKKSEVWYQKCVENICIMIIILQMIKKIIIKLIKMIERIKMRIKMKKI